MENCSGTGFLSADEFAKQVSREEWNGFVDAIISCSKIKLLVRKLFDFELFERIEEKLGGHRSFEIQVNASTDEAKLADRILELVCLDKEKISSALTLDCKSNIFQDKNIVVQKLLYYRRYLQEK